MGSREHDPPNSTLRNRALANFLKFLRSTKVEPISVGSPLGESFLNVFVCKGVEDKEHVTMCGGVLDEV